MGHVPHELAADFPEFADQLHQMKIDDAHFLARANKYHELNREIHRAETDVEPTSDDHLSQLRKKRVNLKDEIYAHLREIKNTANNT